MIAFDDVILSLTTLHPVKGFVATLLRGRFGFYPSAISLS